MWNKEMSVLLSKGLIVLTLIMAVSSVGWFAQCIGMIEVYYYRPFSHLGSCILGFAVIAFACALLVFLFFLLNNISKKKVFVRENVRNLRFISWCCFAVTAILAAWGIVTFLEIIFLAAFITGFIGLILRVVKNVFEEAVALKEENDFTV
ncbi:DUF2975 domain-containing protein [Ruminococcus sp. HUN007]|uniref:DUF2975 domain-containing protein n=1 Tax=Ruminococcus sp. HUN007 TaxID=1514668 RepID=UPI0005D16EFF|nr:DUF2975 domain-containing protein [Ruminococcus sp. HUN007]